ncbi:hypothetical protein [Citrobacter braakii]|uniref:hypothetical protein n=1 Tax=Citrobacter braakii TaxID=57706 RepID=UPI00201B6E54|nr:hypothetical protein [Citrobacter braakii]MEB2439816.1 hypothetical protein [Citrobacter braakii]
MLGFVSALSSAVAVMILLMSVLLTNLLSVTSTKDKKMEHANLLLSTSSGTSNEDTNSVKPGRGYSLSAKDLLPLKNTEKDIVIYCTYGNNLSLNVSQKYSTYNYIIVKKSLGSRVNITVEQPIYEPNKKNTCIAEEITK